MIMKKSLLSVFTMVAMAAAFTACSNDDIEVPDVKNGEARSVFMKLELPTLTRSTEPPVASGTVATVSSRPLKSTHLRDIARKQCPADFFNK